ncbi:MAG: phosphoenolpyruvate mutase [Dehalococcoidales bacterium]
MKKSVYISFSTDVIHGGHIEIIQKASLLGEVTVGILTDEAIASYKRYPVLPYEERTILLDNIKGVSHVVPQTTLSYAQNINELKPDYVVHGDDWLTGPQRPIRDEVIKLLAFYGGELVEYPYSQKEEYQNLESRQKEILSMPDFRRGRLKRLLAIKPVVSIVETHSGLTGLIAEKTTVEVNGEIRQFDGMWCSSLCDATSKGKPDIELLDMSTRMATIDEIMEVTTKPIIFDADTGGQVEHFVYNVCSLERMGVSAVIIEDKTGLKRNSLFGTEVDQTQESIEKFCEKLSAGKRALKTKDFYMIARIESLILEKGMDDALKRAFAYVEAGANGLMIHSRKKDPGEIFQFCEAFRKQNTIVPIVVVPTTFNTVTEDEFAAKGANIVIYANQLTRSGFPAMQNVAKTILSHKRAKEADELCMPISEILTLIPVDKCDC